MLFVFRKSNIDRDVYFDLSSVLFDHRGVYTRLVPIMGSEYSTNVRIKLIISNQLVITFLMFKLLKNANYSMLFLAPINYNFIS